MYLSDYTEAVFDVLSEYEALSSCAVIKAYPYVKMPTNLDYPVIAVTPASVSADALGIGNEAAFGDVKVNADVFVPFNTGSQALSTAVENTVKAVLSLQPSGIGVNKTEALDTIGCLCCKCTFTFKAEI